MDTELAHLISVLPRWMHFLDIFVRFIVAWTDALRLVTMRRDQI